jgi:ABC-2 type transport system ATP-binding protein
MVDEHHIEIEGLSRSFGNVRAVDALSFSAEPGEVTGFLGPNGAGKTTTLRMLLGLVEPTGGRATIGGATHADLDHPADVVGAALEASSFHPGRSGRDHLRVYCTVNGYPDTRAVGMLALVGLTEAARRPVRGYSLGMRQRLGLATALISDPPVLVLDEPSNGPDPAGIAWLRGFLKRHSASSAATPACTTPSCEHCARRCARTCSPTPHRRACRGCHRPTHRHNRGSTHVLRGY